MSHFKPSRTIVIGAVVAVFAIQGIGFRILAASSAGTSFVDGLNIVANLGAVVGCLAACRRGRGAARFFWMLFASAFALQLIGNAGWAWCHFFHVKVSASALFPSLFYRLYAGPMAIALFLSDDFYRSKFEAFLDGCIAVGLVGLTMYQVQIAELGAHDVMIWRVISISGAVNFILVLVAAARFLLSSRAGMRGLFARQAIFLGTYLAVSLVTSFGDAYLSDIDDYIDLLWIVPYLTGAALALTWAPPAMEDQRARPRISRRTALLCFNLTLATMVILSAVLGVRVVDSTRFVGLLAITVVLFSYAIRCSLMQDNQEKYLAALQESRAQLQHQALYDDLTGLPNRRLFAERLDQTLAGAQREGKTVALLYLDLDGFKSVNDRLGHSIGDLLLKAVADRLLARVRRSDTLARMGGDEFTVLLGQAIDREHAETVAKELMHTLCAPFQIEGHRIEITASIGVGVFPENAGDAESLIQQADSAMYEVKHEGKGQVRIDTGDGKTSDLESKAV